MSRRPRFQDDEYPDRDEPRGNRAGAPPTPPPARDPDDHRSNRKSILVDPDEDPKDKAARRHSRSNSQVRIKPPASNYHSSDDEGSVRGHYVKHRNGIYSLTLNISSLISDLSSRPGRIHYGWRRQQSQARFQEADS